jgi:hypothetical protein
MFVVRSDIVRLTTPTLYNIIKINVSLQQAMEAHGVETSRLPHFTESRLRDGQPDYQPYA